MDTRARSTVMTLLLVSVAIPSFSHGTQSHVTASKQRAAPAEQKSFGIAGVPASITRTIDIRMTDQMRFKPSVISVKQGETIRFRHANVGNVMHEMVIGTRADLEEHAALMQKFPNMEHDEPHMVHVAAGKRGDLIWRFNRPGKFEFACLIPGHFEAGMRGTINVFAR